MAVTRVTVVRGLVVVVTVAFLGVLGWYLGQPGYTQARLVLFAALGGLAGAGVLGVFFRRELVIVGATGGLVLLGFWQAVLWVYIFPVVLVFLITVLVLANSDSADSPATE